MGKLLSLPVEKFAGEGAAGTPVRVELLSGEVREGRLGRFDPLHGELSLQPAEGPAERLPFAELRRLLFTTDLAHALQALPGEAHAPQPLALRYRDGRVREDGFLDVRIDHHGLHLLVDAGGRVQREFVPFATLARYRVGSVSGHPMPWCAAANSWPCCWPRAPRWPRSRGHRGRRPTPRHWPAGWRCRWSSSRTSTSSPMCCRSSRRTWRGNIG